MPHISHSFLLSVIISMQLTKLVTCHLFWHIHVCTLKWCTVTQCDFFACICAPYSSCIVAELPAALVILNLSNNPCAENANYR